MKTPEEKYACDSRYRHTSLLEDVIVSREDAKRMSIEDTLFHVNY